MRIFVYEFVTGGGWYDVDPLEPPSGSLLAEGMAMRHAVAEDFSSLPDVRLELLHDERLPCPTPLKNIHIGKVRDREEARARFAETVDRGDCVLIVAPEFNGHLLRCAQQVERQGKRLISPGSDFVSITACKWQTHGRLASARVNTPASWLMESLREQAPALSQWLVIKPFDGCGSQGVQLVHDGGQLPRNENCLVQEYCPGRAASVAALCGSSGIRLLPPCEQTLSCDGKFTYLGGSCPLPERLAMRAQHLARQALGAMPQTIGYVGVDLILSDADDGSEDYVIEINPRLTTSYVGLRTLCKTNLAQTMLDIAQGREPQLEWHEGSVRWSAEGAVERF